MQSKMEECKHEQVLTIYKGGPPTKYNISHYLCPKCSKRDTSSFGIKIIYDHVEETIEKEEKIKPEECDETGVPYPSCDIRPLEDEQYNYCPVCGTDWEIHPKGDCDEGRLIELAKPRFYMMDLENYTEEFLIKILRWQDRYLEHLKNTSENAPKEKTNG